MTYTLYYSQFCYFCQKVLMFLRGQEHQIDFLDISKSENHKALREGGGKGQAPCLCIESNDGKKTWMYESDDIIAYLKQNRLAS